MQGIEETNELTKEQHEAIIQRVNKLKARVQAQILIVDSANKAHTDQQIRDKIYSINPEY